MCFIFLDQINVIFMRLLYKAVILCDYIIKSDNKAACIFQHPAAEDNENPWLISINIAYRLKFYLHVWKIQ